MNQVTEYSCPGPELQSCGRFLPAWLKHLFGALPAASIGIMPGIALAQAADILDDAKENLADVMEIGMWILLAGGYVVAAYMIITGGVRLFQDREGGVGRFALGILVAIVMVVLMSYFVTAGQGEIANIRNS